MPSVLLVDDDPHLLSGLRRALRAQPYQLFTATCGEVAKQMFLRNAFDLVVVDQQMQRLSGVKLVSWIAQEFPRTVRIMLSGQEESSVLLSAINQGQVFRFLVKPCPAARIATTIRDGLDQLPQGCASHGCFCSEPEGASARFRTSFAQSGAVNDSLLVFPELVP